MQCRRWWPRHKLYVQSVAFVLKYYWLAPGQSLNWDERSAEFFSTRTCIHKALNPNAMHTAPNFLYASNIPGEEDCPFVIAPIAAVESESSTTLILSQCCIVVHLAATTAGCACRMLMWHFLRHLGQEAVVHWSVSTNAATFLDFYGVFRRYSVNIYSVSWRCVLAKMASFVSLSTSVMLLWV